MKGFTVLNALLRIIFFEIWVPFLFSFVLKIIIGLGLFLNMFSVFWGFNFSGNFSPSLKELNTERMVLFLRHWRKWAKLGLEGDNKGGKK